MIKEAITPQEVVDLLNDALNKDPEAVTALVYQRIPCNRSLAEHQSIQVDEKKVGQYEVGLLGIINGLFGTHENGQGPITALSKGGREITKFMLTKNTKRD